MYLYPNSKEIRRSSIYVDKARKCEFKLSVLLANVSSRTSSSSETPSRAVSDLLMEAVPCLAFEWAFLNKVITVDGKKSRKLNDANLLYDQFHTLTKGYTHYSPRLANPHQSGAWFDTLVKISSCTITEGVKSEKFVQDKVFTVIGKISLGSANSIGSSA